MVYIFVSFHRYKSCHHVLYNIINFYVFVYKLEKHYIIVIQIH